MIRIIVIIAVAFVLLGSGVAYAINAAAPGEPLYALHRFSEEVQTELTTNPESLVEVQLANAGERLSEAHKLASKDDAVTVDQALDNYDEAMNSVSETVSSAASMDADSLDRVLDIAISEQDELLARLAVQDEPGQNGDEGDTGAVEEGDKSESRYCASGDTHPVAMRYSLRYGVSEVDIMDWFCGEETFPGIGFGFGQIKHALEAETILAGSTDSKSAEDLLERRTLGEGWGQIWKDLGLIGKNKNAGSSEDGESTNQGGPPAHAGPKDKTGPPDHAGPPSHAGSKKDKNKDKNK